MGIKTIAACVTGPETAEPVLRAAVILAQKDNGHLIGLHVREPAVAYSGLGMQMPASMILEFNRAQDGQVAALKDVFETITGPEEFVSEWRDEHADTATAPQRTLEASRAADIVVVAQPDPKGGRRAEWDLVESMIRASGRPVLVVPQGFDGDQIGGSILIGWSGTREATRAAHDSLVVAGKGAEVKILTISRGQRLDPVPEHTAKDLASALARHGLRTTTSHRSADGMEIAEIMTREAFEQGADLIVTGAFGHSTVYDFVIGAVTRELLIQADRPVLFAK